MEEKCQEDQPSVKMLFTTSSIYVSMKMDILLTNSTQTSTFNPTNHQDNDLCPLLDFGDANSPQDSQSTMETPVQELNPESPVIIEY